MFLVKRALGHLRKWKNQLPRIRRPNLWRLVGFCLFVVSASASTPIGSHDLTSLAACHLWFSAGSSTGSIKARFENIAKQKEEEDKKRAEEERARRQTKERQEQEEARRMIEETPKAPSPAPAASPSPTPPVHVRLSLWLGVIRN